MYLLQQEVKTIRRDLVLLPTFHQTTPPCRAPLVKQNTSGAAREWHDTPRASRARAEKVHAPPAVGVARYLGNLEPLLQEARKCPVLH